MKNETKDSFTDRVDNLLDNNIKEIINKISGLKKYTLVDYKGIDPVILGIKLNENSFSITTDGGEQYQVYDVSYKINQTLSEPVLSDIKLREYNEESGYSQYNGKIIHSCNITGKTKHIKQIMQLFGWSVIND